MKNKQIEDEWFKQYPALSYAYYSENDKGSSSLVTGFNRDARKSTLQINQFKDSFTRKHGDSGIHLFEVDGVRLIPPLPNEKLNEQSNKDLIVQAPSSIARTWPYNIGTLGAILKIKKIDYPILLTCHHVLKLAEKDDDIQLWCGKEALAAAQYIDGFDSSFLDFAIAKVKEKYVDKVKLSMNLGYNITFENQLRATEGFMVGYAKTKGAMSGIGKIINSTGCTVKVNLENGRTKLYKNQIVVDKKISSEGDSGSVAIRIPKDDKLKNLNGKTFDAIGLVFAEGYSVGDEKEGERTFMNPITDVYNQLQLLIN